MTTPGADCGAAGVGSPCPSALKLPVPSREEIEALDPFIGIAPDSIRLVTNREDVDSAFAVLARQVHVGFDTESRPTFLRGEQSDGPHVLQFATLTHAYVFQTHVTGARAAVAALLQSPTLMKVGFGLDSDKTRIRAKLGIQPRAVLDLDLIFRERGYRKSVGLKAAVAIVFGQRFSKSKRIGTSNWSARRLTDRQLLYAANDAHAAIRVFAALAQARRTEVPVDRAATG